MKNISFLVIGFVFIFLSGYFARMYHAQHIWENRTIKAETDLQALEDEFYSACIKPRNFWIFNHQYEVYPVDCVKNRFHYKKVADVTGHTSVGICVQTTFSDEELFSIAGMGDNTLQGK